MLLLGETKKQYADLLATQHNGVFPAETEIWTCNAGFRIWQHDLLFVMDDLELEAYRFPAYGRALEQHEGPILTSHPYDAWPSALAYPFLQICETLNLKGLDRYFYNTVPYMLAYACAIGVKHLTIFGADYYHPNAPGREADLANAEWWLGYCRAKGVDLTLANDTTLMRAREHAPLYGYRFDPRIAMDRVKPFSAKKPQQQSDEKRRQAQSDEQRNNPRYGKATIADGESFSVEYESNDVALKNA